MWPLFLLTLTFLLMLASSDGRQMTVADCTPPYLAVGNQCLLVDEDSSKSCSSPFVAVGDQCIFFDTFAELSYHEAVQLCHSLDSELAVVDTATRHKNIIDYIYNNGLELESFWISGSDEAMEGRWVFDSGELVPMGTPFWAGWMTFQEPNNIGDNEDCLCLFQSDRFYMNDMPCDTIMRALCEIPSSVNTKVSRPLPRVDCLAFFVPVGSLCLSFMTWADQTWDEARQSCHGLAGELATITDIEDLRAIYLYLHQEGIATHSFWLGGSDEAAEGVWTWTDGSHVPMGSPFWGIAEGYTIEPNGGSSENCLLLNAQGFYYFRDNNCDHLMHPLCQAVV